MSTAALLLFDIDGTLLLSGGAGLEALNQTFEEQFGVAEAFTGLPVAGRTDPGLIDEAASRSGLVLSAVDRRRFHDRYCDRLAVELEHPRPRKRLMPGVTALMSRLHARADVTLAILTGNLARAAHIKLEHFGLRSFFVCGAFGDDAPTRDDLVPVAMRRAARLGVAPDTTADVVVIGDTPLDIRCARAAGARCIAVATGSYDQDALVAHAADAVLPDLSNADRFVETVAAVRLVSVSGAPTVDAAANPDLHVG